MTDPRHAGALAHLITFHTYGTWLPGDPRGSVRRGEDYYGEPYRRGDGALLARASALLRAAPVVFEDKERALVLQTIQDVCRFRVWRLYAAHVRTNHVHVVVAAGAAAGKIIGDLKAWGTRRLVEAQLRTQGAPVWAREGGARTLWRASAVEGACFYVLHEQGQVVPGTVWPPP
jgi:REP element-mobilizing transposase RayT